MRKTKYRVRCYYHVDMFLTREEVALYCQSCNYCDGDRSKFMYYYQGHAEHLEELLRKDRLANRYGSREIASTLMNL